MLALFLVSMSGLISISKVPLLLNLCSIGDFGDQTPSSTFSMVASTLKRNPIIIFFSNGSDVSCGFESNFFGRDHPMKKRLLSLGLKACPDVKIFAAADMQVCSIMLVL